MLEPLDLERLAQVGSRLSLDPLASERELIQTVFDTLQTPMDAQIIGLLLLEAPQPGLYYTAHEPPTVTLCQQLEKRLLSVLDSLLTPEEMPQSLEHHPLPGCPQAHKFNLTEFIGLPLVVEGRIAGLLFATRAKLQPNFTAIDLTLLGMVCGQLGVTWKVLHLNRQLAEQNRQLQALNSYREDFIRNLSHDLRTPLTCILGYAELMQQYGERLKPEQNTEFVGQIVIKSKSLRLMIDNLLDFGDGQEQNIQVETVNLSECLRQARIDIEPLLAEKQQRLLLNVPVFLPPVLGDTVLLVKVLLNLLHNSQKFSPVGSELLLEAQHREQWVRVCVRDRGPGVDPEALERVFERFRQEGLRPVQSSAEGLGLGLAVCKDIIEAFNGRIWAENRSEGTAFCFELRLAT